MNKHGCKKIRLELVQSFDKAIEGISKYMDDHHKITIFDASLILAYQFPDIKKEDAFCHLKKYRKKKK